MKTNTILVSAICIGVLFFTSCKPSMRDNQLKYTHTTLVDGDAYEFFQVVGKILPFEIGYATYVENSSSSNDSRVLAKAIREEFVKIMSDLDGLATKNQVDFPISGARQFVSTDNMVQVVNTLDSTEGPSQNAVLTGVSDKNIESDYKTHMKHQIEVMKEQFKRLSRNTNEHLRDYANSMEEEINTLYKMAGGHEENGSHH